MKTLLFAALILASVVSCNRDRIESPEGAANDTVLQNPASDGTLTDTAFPATTATVTTDTVTTSTTTTTAPPSSTAPNT